MVSLFQRHCSDGSLICHLDGELPFYLRAAVRRHLKRCWSCRLRLSEIESQVMVATRAMENDTFPGPARIAEARLRFMEQADRVAAEVAYGQRVHTGGRTRKLAWAAAAGGIVLCGVFLWRFTRSGETGAPAAAMQRIAAAEAQSASAPVHQRFRVVARQVRPVPVSRENRLDVWSEPSRGHFATSYKDARGTLRHAVWQPAPDQQYVFRASESTQVIRISRRQAQENWSLLRDGMTLEDLESGLLNWLENRPWRPVSFSKVLAALANSDGASLTMRETEFEGRPVVRLTARKTAGAVAVEFVLDVDPRSYTPRLQKVRYESPARTLELQLYSEEVSPTMVSSFEPPPELLSPAPLPTPAVTMSAPPRVPEPAANADIVELEIHRALHSVHACLGETIVVDTAPDGRFEVRGVVAGVERRDQLAAALAPVANSRVTVDIRSSEEVLREIRPDSLSQAAQHAVAPGDRPKQHPGWLLHAFGDRANEADEFADRVLSSGEDFMREAQALRQLEERFGGRPGFDSRGLRQQLRDMERDHLNGLAMRIEATRRLLAPIVPESAFRPAAVEPQRSWDEALVRIFDLSKALNDQLRTALTTAEAGAAHDRLVAAIGDAFSRVQTAIDSVR